MNTKNISIKDIDYKELAKECKIQEDLANLTKQFMKNMIENMLKAEIDEHIEKNKDTSKNGYYSKTVKSDAGKIKLFFQETETMIINHNSYLKEKLLLVA